MITDTRIVASVGGFNVLHQHHEIQLADGTLLAMHLVAHPPTGVIDMFRRAWVSPATGVTLFDIRRLDNSLDAEMRRHPARDIPGIVMYTLRPRFATGGALHQAIVACHEAWAPSIEELRVAA